MISKLNKTLIFTFLLCFTINSMAGSCCGGGASGAEIMLGDTDSVWRQNYTDKTLLADTNSTGELNYREESEVEAIRTLNLSFSKKISDFWQWGASLPIVEKTKSINKNWKSDTGLGDIKLNLAYEFLPEFGRNTFTSQGFIFFELTTPTAPSLYTTKRTDSIDTRGTGHYLYTFGSIFKSRQKYGQILLTTSLSYRPSMTFDDSLFSDDKITTEESMNNSIIFAGDLDISESFIISSSISRLYTENKIISNFSQSSQESLIHPLTIGASYIFDSSSVIVSYTDEMTIPSSYGTPVGRIISLGFIKRINL